MNLQTHTSTTEQVLSTEVLEKEKQNKQQETISNEI